jgi:hypothetical protein
LRSLDIPPLLKSWQKHYRGRNMHLNAFIQHLESGLAKLVTGLENLDFHKPQAPCWKPWPTKKKWKLGKQVAQLGN